MRTGSRIMTNALAAEWSMSISMDGFSQRQNSNKSNDGPSACPARDDLKRLKTASINLTQPRHNNQFIRMACDCRAGHAHQDSALGKASQRVQDYFFSRGLFSSGKSSGKGSYAAGSHCSFVA